MDSISKSLMVDMLHKYGEDSQIDVAIEEMSELTKELLKYRRTKIHAQEKIDLQNVFWEIADVTIMLEYLKIIFNLNEVMLQNMVGMKLERTRRRYLDDGSSEENNNQKDN